MPEANDDSRSGYLQAVGAYLLWGLFPLFWKQVGTVPAGQLVAHRIVQSAIVLAVIGAFSTMVDLRRVIADRRALAVHAVAAVLIATNWLTFLFAVATDRVVDSSLGYFMTPLVSVVLALVVLRERLSAWQKTAVALAVIGVGILTVEAGIVPWIAIILALSFGSYGLVRKLSPLESLEGLTTEMLLLLAPSALFLVVVGARSEIVVPGGWRLAALLGAGFVTITPLLMFAAAARKIPLTAVGLLLYLNPLIQFLLGVLVFDEPLSVGRFGGFVVIWAALVVFAADGWRRRPSADRTADRRIETSTQPTVQP